MTDIQLDHITTGETTGNGAFDALMRSVRVHLEEEYKSQRIRGTEYSQVYLQSLNAVLQQSIQFVLTEQQASAQAALTEAQASIAEEQLLLIQEQVLQAKHQTTLIQEQVVGQQKANAIADQQLLNLQAQYPTIVKQEDQLDAQILLTEAQKENTTQQTLLAEQKTLAAAKEPELMDKQIAKADAEIGFTEQRKLTEEAQIMDVVDNGSTVVTGVVGIQKQLYEKQRDGFIRDAEQRAAGIMANIAATRQTTVGVDADDFDVMNLGYQDVGDVMAKLKQGVNA